MQTFSDKDQGRTIADSFTTVFGSRLPMWFSTKQLEFSHSKSVSTETETTGEQRYHVNFSESRYQEQDSSSTLSSGQSHHEAPTSERSNFHMQKATFQPGSLETHKKLYGNADYTGHQVQTEHLQSLGCISYPLAGSCFGRIAAAYEPNAVVFPQMIGVAQARLVLPLDCTEGIPVYVNAKQYHAILRRRQTRAKLEADNKVVKSKKPYLHESRHRHALKRARGSGGRFLNTKTTQQPNSSTQTCQKNLSLHHTSKYPSEPEIHHSERYSWRASTTSGSDVSSIFNNDDIFQQPDLRVTISSLTTGPTGHTGPPSHVMGPDNMLPLSMDLRAQISSST